MILDLHNVCCDVDKDGMIARFKYLEKLKGEAHVEACRGWFKEICEGILAGRDAFFSTSFRPFSRPKINTIKIDRTILELFKIELEKRGFKVDLSVVEHSEWLLTVTLEREPDVASK